MDIYNKKLLIYDYLKDNPDEQIIKCIFYEYSDIHNFENKLTIDIDKINDEYFLNFLYKLIYHSKKSTSSENIENSPIIDDIEILISENELRAIEYTKTI